MTRIESIANLYVATFGKDATKAQLKVYTDFKETVTLESISATMAGAEGAIVSPSTAEAQVKAAYANVFGYTDAELTSLVSTEGFAYWVKEVKENPFITTETLNIALLKGADASDEAKALTHSAITLANYNANSVDTSDYILLTEGQDILTGTDADDTFIARGNNSFNNSDIIDGGAGRDTVEVMLDSEDSAESPLLKNIEVLKVQGQASQDRTDQMDENATASVDAGDMKSVEEFWSEDSRSDVYIEGIERNSHETKIGFRSSDAGDVDYTALFYNPTDKGSTEEGATLTLDIVNVQALTDGGGALDENQYLGFKFSLNGTEYTVQSDDFKNASTYEELRDAVNAQLVELGLTSLSAELGAITNVFNSTTGILVGQKTAIVITNSAEGTLTYPSSDAWITEAGAPANDNVQANMSNLGPQTSGSLTQVDVELDYVGHGSPSGDLLIGNMSDGTTHEGSEGIQQFNVEVDRDSSLASMKTTSNDLEVINLVNIGKNGNITIADIQDVQTLNATAMVGEVNITATLSDKITEKYTNRVDSQSNPINDNIKFDYLLGKNNDTLDLTISKVNLEDAGSVTREDFVLNIKGNNGKDMITTKIGDGSGIITNNWYVNHVINSNLTIDAGNDDDTVNTYGAGNFTVDLGQGNDTYYADNSGLKAKFVLNAVNADINDLQSNTLTSTNAVNVGLTVTFLDITTDLSEVANSYGQLANVAITDLNVNQAIKFAIQNDKRLNKLIVAEDGPANTLIITSLIDGTLDIADFTVNVSDVVAGVIPEITAATITSQTAIVPALNFTAAATVDNNFGTVLAQDYAVSSLQTADLAAGGLFVYGGLTITATAIATAEEVYAMALGGVDTNLVITGVATAAATAGEDSNTLTLTDVALSNTVGSNSSAVSSNMITGNTGDDVIVLGTDATSIDTLVFAGKFGNDTIVNFESDAGVVAASDKLDFTAYLGSAVTTLGAVAATDSLVTVALETLTNGTEALIAGLYNGSDNTTAGTTLKQLYIAYDADNVGKVYEITDGAVANDVTAALVGTIHLAEDATDSSAWNQLAAADLV